MNGIDFIDLVASMRVAQKEYFKKRTQGNLVAAKKFEANVDKALKDQLQFKIGEDRPPELMETPRYPKNKNGHP
jgi:hypothetical protein